MRITETRSVEIFSSFHILYCLSNDYLQSSSSTYLLQSYSSKQVILQFSFIVIWILIFFLLCTLSNLSCDPPNVKKGLFYFHYYLVAYIQIKKHSCLYVFYEYRYILFSTIPTEPQKICMRECVGHYPTLSLTFLVEYLKYCLCLNLVVSPLQLVLIFLSPFLWATNTSQVKHGSV